MSHVAMALLAARIFEDKDFFGQSQGQSTNAKRLLKFAESKSNGFFRRVLENDVVRLNDKLGAPAFDEILRQTLSHLTGP